MVQSLLEVKWLNIIFLGIYMAGIKPKKLYFRKRPDDRNAAKEKTQSAETELTD